MSSAKLCLACAQLPIKDGGLAVKKARCPDCKAEIGVTSYGGSFRVQAKRGLSFLTPKFMIGAGVGAGLFTFVILLVGLGVISKEKIATPQRADRPAPFDLKKVPEVAVTNHFGAKPNPSV